MDQFIGREQEMAFLEGEYHRKGSSLVILYGRRRVGKTTLASQFIKGKSALYFLVTEESESQNRQAFQELVADFTGQVLLITNVVPLLLGTFAESCSLILPQKGRKEGHAFLRAVA